MPHRPREHPRTPGHQDTRTYGGSPRKRRIPKPACAKLAPRTGHLCRRAAQRPAGSCGKTLSNPRYLQRCRPWARIRRGMRGGADWGRHLASTPTRVGRGRARTRVSASVAAKIRRRTLGTNTDEFGKVTRDSERSQAITDRGCPEPSEYAVPDRLEHSPAREGEAEHPGTTLVTGAGRS
jgi:hypothetical protein